MGKQSDLWASVVNQGLQMYESQMKPSVSTLIVVGAAKAGKSTLINNFLDRQDDGKGSLPVEYTYARRTNKHMIKDVCNIWEINIANISFVDQLAENEKLDAASVAVVVDLSRPQHLLYTCHTVMQFLKNRSRSSPPISYGLIGMKYDQFEDREWEKKSIVGRLMKHYAAEMSAHLIFATKQDRTTLKMAKDLFSNLAFQTKFSYQIKSDLDDLLLIPRGSSESGDLEHLRQSFRTQFGKEVDYKSDSTLSNPGDDLNYAQEQIDKRRKGVDVTKSSHDPPEL